MDLKRLREYIEIVAGLTGISVGLSYAFGFVIWNIYLQRLDFYPNLFQGRFILTGIAFILITLSFFGLLLLLKNILEKILPTCLTNYSFFKPKNDDISWTLRFASFGTIIILCIFTFSFFIFPTIPGYFGGAKPKLLSFIGDEQNIKYLNEFGISTYKFQTVLLCSIYDDNNYIIIVLKDRILSFKKDLFKGFVSLPNQDYNKYVEECNTTVITNLMGWRKLIISN